MKTNKHHKLKYLGHIVSKRACECDPKMLAPVKSWKTLENVKKLTLFLGFANFYQRFIYKEFAHIAETLTSLFEYQVKKHHRKNKGGKVKEPKHWIWYKKRDHAFSALHDKLTEHPLLAYPDFS